MDVLRRMHLIPERRMPVEPQPDEFGMGIERQSRAARDEAQQIVADTYELAGRWSAMKERGPIEDAIFPDDPPHLEPPVFTGSRRRPRLRMWGRRR